MNCISGNTIEEMRLPIPNIEGGSSIDPEVSDKLRNVGDLVNG